MVNTYNYVGGRDKRGIYQGFGRLEILKNNDLSRATIRLVSFGHRIEG